MEGIKVVALRGPIEQVGEHRVPIFEAATFGAIGGEGERLARVSRRTIRSETSAMRRSPA